VRRARIRLLPAIALASLAIAPATASAHAVLRETEPISGAIAKREPSEIVFRYNEPVEGNFGAIRVYDRNGSRVEDGQAFHPGGRGPDLAAHLKAGLPKGTYTATYRVISADGHPVSGGLVFSIGKPSPTAGKTVSQLLAERGKVSEATDVGFAIARGLQDVSIAAAIGIVVYLFLIWLPALASVAGGDRRWQLASESFVARIRTLLAVAVVIGALSAALGIVFQGATAADVSFWSALKAGTIKEVLGTRWGTVWGLRVLVWLGLGAVLTAALARGRQPVLRPASVGATGLALARPFGPIVLGLIALPLGFLAISPALAGHASLESPTGVMTAANVIHVISISVWSAGVATLVLALRRATRELEPPDRARLLAANVIRFSQAAGVAFALLVATGLIQAYVEVRSIHNLLHTEFGRLVLIKFTIVLGPLLALGAYNRRLNVPHLREIAATGQSPGRSGRLLRRSLRAEIALILVVFGVTAVLVSKPPSIALSNSGPVAKTVSLGPADLQLTVDPARVGSNVMHAFLTDKRSGVQYDKVKEFDVTLSQPDKQVGPIDAGPQKAGPGHYVMTAATFGVPGDWKVQVAARVSEFDAYYATVDVKVK
jgi:copper transport protein